VRTFSLPRNFNKGTHSVPYRTDSPYISRRPKTDL